MSMKRKIVIEMCGKCPYFDEGEISYYTSERWTDDSCLKGYGKVSDKCKILSTCKLEEE